MGKRGPHPKNGRVKSIVDYTRIDFDDPVTPDEISALAKLKAMKPRDRTEYLTAVWAEDQVRFLGGVSRE